MAKKPTIKEEKISISLKDGKGTLLYERKMSDSKTHGNVQEFAYSGTTITGPIATAINAARAALDLKDAEAPIFKAAANAAKVDDGDDEIEEASEDGETEAKAETDASDEEPEEEEDPGYQQAGLF